jgi:transcriptional antiterminator NusG
MPEDEDIEPRKTGMSDRAANDGAKTSPKTSPGEFIKQVKVEARKVVWPTRQETLTTGMFVGLLLLIWPRSSSALTRSSARSFRFFCARLRATAHEEAIMARWYIIHAYSGFENKVKEAIIAEAERLGLEKLVEQVEVPSEQVTEVKRGKKVVVERKTMPGYVLAKLTMNDDVYHLVKNTAKVTGFLGNNGKPQAISERDAERYFGAREQVATQVKKHVAVDYEIGDRSRCSTGPSAASPALWKSWISTRTASRFRCRSLAAPRRSSWTSSMSNW